MASNFIRKRKIKLRLLRHIVIIASLLGVGRVRGHFLILLNRLHRQIKILNILVLIFLCRLLIWWWLLHSHCIVKCGLLLSLLATTAKLLHNFVDLIRQFEPDLALQFVELILEHIVIKLVATSIWCAVTSYWSALLQIRNLLIEKLLSAFFSEAVHVIVHPLVNTVLDYVMNPIPQCQRHPPHVGIIHILFLGLHCLGSLLFWSWSPCRLDGRRRSFVINTLCIFWKLWVVGVVFVDVRDVVLVQFISLMMLVVVVLDRVFELVVVNKALSCGLSSTLEVSVWLREDASELARLNKDGELAPGNDIGFHKFCWLY